MYACDYLETGFLNVLRGVTFAAPTKVYLALFLNDPGDSGTAGTEISYAGYARMEIAFSEPAVSNGGIGIQNLSDITFAAPADPAGTVTHIAIMDSLVGGNMLARSELTESLVTLTAIQAFWSALAAGAVNGSTTPTKARPTSAGNADRRSTGPSPKSIAETVST